LDIRAVEQHHAFPLLFLNVLQKCIAAVAVFGVADFDLSY
jgi:hypothetical protein